MARQSWENIKPVQTSLPCLDACCWEDSARQAAPFYCAWRKLASGNSPTAGDDLGP